MLSQLKEKFDCDGELYLRIKVFPGAVKTEVREILADETIKIGVAAPREKNKANNELIKFLALKFGISQKKIKIISGCTASLKLIKIKK